MLACSFSNRELLQLCSATAANRDANFIRRRQGPGLRRFGSDFGEWHLDSARAAARFTDLPQKGGGEVRVWGGFERHLPAR